MCLTNRFFIIIKGPVALMIIKGLVACVLFFNLRAHGFNSWVARSKKKFCNSPLGEGICKDITPLSLKKKFKSMSATESKSKDDNNLL